MITAAIESSSARSPNVGEPAFVWPAVTRPPTAAVKPLITYTEIKTRLTGIPVRRAPSGFPPTAYSHLPHTTNDVSTTPQRASPSTMNVEYGNQPIEPPPRTWTA